jgi:UDP-N-acetyl-D-mannosaminuronic acid dehydrogenase
VSQIKVTMMGLGYIGLPTAVLMAGKGLNVLGVDIKPDVVNIINNGKVHIVEPDLAGLVKSVVDSGKLRASTKVEKSDVFIIAVPTPFKGSNHEPDISYVESATNMIMPHLEADNLVLLESTSPVGTTGKIASIIFRNRPELEGKIYIAYCPERVLPGKILYELENNDRSIGGVDVNSTEKAICFYSHFVKGKLHRTESKTAEMCKLVENSYRDVNIAFANELSVICDKAGIDVLELIQLSNKHPRVNILAPGAGVGGHCIAVDPWFIVSEFPDESRIIRCAREVNNSKPHWVVNKVLNEVDDYKKRKGIQPKVACMGLAYKPDIDDLRESPSLEIVEVLNKKIDNLIIVEPNIDSCEKFKLVDYESANKTADIIVFLVPHKEFNSMTVDKTKVIIDICGVMK